MVALAFIIAVFVGCFIGYELTVKSASLYFMKHFYHPCDGDKVVYTTDYDLTIIDYNKKSSNICLCIARKH